MDACTRLHGSSPISTSAKDPVVFVLHEAQTTNEARSQAFTSHPFSCLAEIHPYDQKQKCGVPLVLDTEQVVFVAMVTHGPFWDRLDSERTLPPLSTIPLWLTTTILTSTSWAPFILKRPCTRHRPTVPPPSWFSQKKSIGNTVPWAFFSRHWSPPGKFDHTRQVNVQLIV